MLSLDFKTSFSENTLLLIQLVDFIYEVLEEKEDSEREDTLQ